MARRSKKKSKYKKKIIKKSKKNKISKRTKKNKKVETSSELVIKTKNEWIKRALINKSGYQVKYKNLGRSHQKLNLSLFL